MADPTNPGEPEVEEEVVTPDAELETPETDDDGNPVETPEPETEEVEHEGKKYKIPKPLKGALLMQADYTRKTQEVAEQRKAVEAERTRIADDQKAHAEFIADVGKVEAYKEALGQYEKVDWATLRQQNPASYDEHWFQYNQLKERAGQAASQLQQKFAQRETQRQQETAMAFEKFRSDTFAQVPEMANPEFVTKLNTFAQSYGFTAQELSQVRDPRIVKVLKAAFDGSQAQTKQAAVKKAATAEAAKPLPTVKNTGGNRVSLTDPAADTKLSADEWAKRRNEQLRKQRGR